MATNRFATMLHKNTHRMAFLLIYTMLEWILIVLLLFNALLSYFIAKFASFFGLKAPCIFCTRVDHLFQASKGQSNYKDLLCDSHAGEISKLGFCSKHRRLSETGDMCEDCAFQRDGSIEEEKGDAFGREKDELEELKEDDSKGEILIPSVGDMVEDALAAIIALPLEKMDDEKRIVPLELIDSSTMMRFYPQVHDADDVILQRDAAGDETGSIDVGEISEKQSFGISCEDAEERDAILKCDSHAPTLVHEFSEDVSFNGQTVVPQEATHAELVSVINAEEFEEQRAFEEGSKLNEEVNCEISIGSDICDQEQIEQVQIHEFIPEPEFLPEPDQSLESFNETTDREIVTEPEPLKRIARQVKHLVISPVLNEIVEEGMPETPTTPFSIEGFTVLPKRFLLERRESGTESLDGSIASDLDNIEPLTLDRLKAALKSDRKSLTALYAELEEERSASAIAANQTMAMITRLQEEKAAMQMEALHYQRMMEEQSEYDQEALQILNELMMKREKEKQELEEELDLYHEKVLMFEARERSMKAGNKEKDSMGGTASGLSSSEDSDDVSFELCECEESTCGPHESKLNTLSYVENTDILDGCLSEFEEHRLFILNQFKALVEKLFKMDNEDETGDLETTKQCWVENGHGVNGECKLLGDDIRDGSVNCISHDLQTNGKLHSKQRSAGIQGKSLLPLFDAISLESEEKLSTVDDSIDGQKKLANAEELDQVYKRLQALEVDCDFIKHCIASLKKGKKGMNLLQEIIQNLHDLRAVEIHTTNSNF